MTDRGGKTEPIEPLGATQVATTTGPSAAPAPGWTSGILVGGRYELVAQLGRGAHGAVYRAVDRVAETEVALKILIDLRDDSLALMRRELAAARRVTHRGVVRVFDLVELGDADVAALQGIGGRRAWALSMELVEGKSLELELERGPTSAARLGQLADLLSDALGAAHEAGVVHRDLKPANILVRPDGTTVLTDFGVSRTSATALGGAVRSTGGGAVKLTVEGALLGTPLYMSPEQLVGRTDVGPPADVYALGLVLYEAATGRVPHEALTVDELRSRRAREPVPLLHTMRTDVSLRLSEVIARCLEADPMARFPDALAVHAALHPSKPSAVLSRRAPRSAVWRIALGTLGALTVGGALAVAWRTVRPLRTPGAPTSSVAASAPSVAPRATFELRPKNPRRLAVGTVCDEFPSFFPDGRRVAFDKTVGVKSHIVALDIDSNEQRQLTSSPMWDFAPAVSPDGKHVAFVRSVGRTRTTQLLDVATGTLRELGPGDFRPAFSPNGELWLGTRTQVSRIDLTTGEVRARLPISDGQEVGRLHEMPDGKLIVLFLSQATYSGRAAAYDLRAERWLDEVQGDFVDGIATSPDGKAAFLISGQMTQARFAEGRFTLDERSAALARVRSGMAISPRGDRIIWSTCDGLSNLSRVENGQLSPALDAQRDWSNVDVGFLQDGRLILSSDRDGGKKSLWIGRLGTGEVERLSSIDGPLGTLATRGFQLVVATSAGLQLLDFDRGDGPSTLTTDKALNPSFDAHGNVVYWVREGNETRLRRVETATRTVTTLGPTLAREPAPSPRDERIVFVGGADANELRLLEASGHTRPFGKDLPKGAFTRPTFSPDASRVVVVHDLNEALVIDAASERVLETLTLKRGTLEKPVFDPDGALYFIGSEWTGDLWVADLE